MGFASCRGIAAVVAAAALVAMPAFVSEDIVTIGRSPGISRCITVLLVTI
jgi:hypothetical protein